MSETSNLLQLPLDVLTNIFKYVKLNDLRNLMLTCITLRNLLVENSSLWRWFFRNQLIIENRINCGDDVMSRYDCCRISYNWRNGIYETKQLVNFNIKFMPWIKLTPEVLLLTVGSELRCFNVDKYGLPNTRKTVWKFEVPSIKRYDVRTNDISRFVLKDNLLVCGNRDGSAAVYKVDDIKKKPKLLQHIPNCHADGEIEVSAVDAVYNSTSCYVITASMHCPRLIFWRWHGHNYGANDLYNTRLVEHTQLVLDKFKGIRSMSLSKDCEKLAIGPNGYNKPLIADVNTISLISNLDQISYNKRKIVRDIHWHDENTVASVSHNGVLELMDIRSHQTIYEVFDPFHSSLYCVRSDGNNAIVVGSAEYSRCVLFDRRRSNSHVQMYFTQKKTSPVYCLDFDASKLITAVDRGVAVVDFDVFIESIEPKDCM